MTIEANVSFRILTPRSVLEGSGNPNALENINPSQLPDGCLCWVISEAALYRYEAEGIESRAYPDIIPTCYGEGTKGRWRRTIQDAAPSTSVNCCATADVNLLAPVVSFDTHVLVDNNRVLLPFQTDQTENGIYSWDAISGLLTRADDFDTGEEFVPGLIVSVTQGNQYLGADFRLVNTAAVVLGVTDILFGLSSGILLVDQAGITVARHDQLQVIGALLSSVGQANVIDIGRNDIREQGADPTGVADSRAAILLAAAVGAVTATASGIYRVASDTNLTVDAYEDQGEFVPDSGVRFVATNMARWNRVLTAGGIEDTLLTFSIPTNTEVSIQLTMRGVGAAERARYQRVGTWRNVAGVVTELAAMADERIVADDAAWAPAVLIVGTNITVVATPDAANNVTWLGRLVADVEAL